MSLRLFRTILLLAFPAALVSAAVIPTAGFVIARDGTKLYYEIAGAGDRTIVVSGGFLLRDALDPLTRDFRVVFYDARGRGRSDATPDDRISFQHQVDDLEDIRDALRIERMTVLGWSGMGKELFGYVLQYPERVERMVQVGPVPPVPSDFFARMMERRFERVDDQKLKELRSKREAGVWADDPAGYCRAETDVTKVMTFADPAHAAAHPDICRWPNEWPVNVARLFGALLPSIDAFDPRPGIATNSVPRLVLVGSEDAITPERARAWVDGAPDACLVVIDGAAHWPFVERPDRFFTVVKAFLSGVDTGECHREATGTDPEGLSP